MMSAITETHANEDESRSLRPVQAGERIAVLDVIRGFALIGIFLMNIEFFNRPVGELGDGMPVGLSGGNWMASYLIAYFVAGKFWTIFSLLFGMGFALMLGRSEQKTQEFIPTYLRRLFALAAFGILHHIFIWPGDILYSYAVAACGLLLILFGKPRWIFGAAIVVGFLSAIPAMHSVGTFAIAFAIYGCIAWLLRSERTLIIFHRPIAIMSVAFVILAVLLFILGLLAFVVPFLMKYRAALLFSLICVGGAYVFQRLHQPIENRPWKLGSLIYLSLFLSMLMGGIAQYFAVSDPAQSVNQKVDPLTASHPPAASELKGTALNNTRSSSNSQTLTQSDATKQGDVKQTQEQKEAERLKKKKDTNLREVEILTKGSYKDALLFRANEFAGKWADVAIFSVLINCMFLIGFWFVRSGVMANTHAHRDMFKKIVLLGMPIGLGMGIAGSLLSTAPLEGQAQDPYLISMALLYLGNLPACMAYVSLLILMFNSRGYLSKVRVLAPYGRMALTNYLSQSIICSLLFYSYGLGYYGMQRADQVAVVFVVVLFQIALSHWWLAKFRFGPVEWLWRAITYWEIPKFKV
ncbi:DUF418 domain-containing protein [Undibacterium fentianense]|uniref:DUF418 domain-containing protein n=1 Tax=Undibacterium fentianense TaxID=2828728 RepID=A0A941IBI1_9BURK|nr:DUF418 domain-containing protein [Undibacterium fentianense]MBR7799084.1 DUF418 domain-containing protein [Undibacterium fentianense]